MSTEEEYNVAARYRTVRKHLDSLGYKHALSLDALPLIEKLLADLIQTTESLKHFKSVAQDNIEACSQLQLTVDPYKCDNARLVRENNQLHLELIETKEAHHKQIRDLKKEVYKLESECNDLQLASSRNLQKIKELESESSKKSKKILELQGKCLKPTISNAALASKKRSCYPLRRPVLESEPLPKSGAKANPLPSLSNVDPKVLDVVNMADHKMNCLSHEVTKLRGELSIQTDNVQTLKSQLTSKEKEIMRLTKMLEGGRPYSAVHKDCACKKVENNCAVSNGNIEANELRILQQAKLELEQQLKEALNKQHDAMSQALKLAERNEELEKELRDIDHIALAVEADCNSTVKENNRRVCKLQGKLEDVMTQVHVLEGELTVERREMQELRADLEACKLEKRNIQRTLETTLDEKKQMTNTINELTVIEKSLNDEIDRLAKENENQKQDIIHLQYTNRMLKEKLDTMDIVQGVDGDDLNRVKEKGAKNDHNKASKNHRDIIPSAESNQAQFEQILKEREVTRDANSSGYSDILLRLSEKDSQIANLQQAIGQLRRERDYYKEEYNNIKDHQNRVTDNDTVELWSRVQELKRQLSEKENALHELQQEKRDMSREKANLETRLQFCKTEHRKCNCPSSSASMRDVGITKTMIERLEHDRDMARADVERVLEERDALRERLKMAAEAHTSEQRRLRENLADVEARFKQIEKERQELLLTQGTRRATINGLEDQLDDMREELKRTKQELATQRTQYFQLRALQDQTDQALGDVQNQLTQSETELNNAMDRNRAMDRQQLQFENQVKDLKQEIHTLRLSMTHLDHEKDQLLMVLDEKTERIAGLERELMSKERQASDMEQQMRELQHKNEICIDQTANQERQVRSMQLEVENLQRQLQTASSDRENAIQENRRLQDDLAAVTCEVRNLQRELDASREESYDLKRQLQTYVSEVRRAEELLNRKENERTEMLNHFRSLSLEATVLENNNHSLESEAAEARGALQSASDRLLDLERQLADRDSLIRGYETQISELTQNIASMETQLHQQGEQRHRAEADLTAVRDLCVKLDHHKDALMQQLDDKDSLKTQYDSQIARLKAEQAMIQDQMNRDRATVERLETLLDQARQESMNTQTANQELQNEMSRLKHKISELQSKLSAESAELRQYQNQAAEYSKQISELRRQVTNERFDRARKDEEHRRNSEAHTNTLFHQESAQEPTQAPRPVKHTEWNGEVTNRSLQRERIEGYGVAADRSGIKTAKHFDTLRTEYLSETNNCRCIKETHKTSSNTKEVSNDVPCISIILRPNFSAKSNQDEPGKGSGQPENNLSRINEDLQRNKSRKSEHTDSTIENVKNQSRSLQSAEKQDLSTLPMLSSTRVAHEMSKTIKTPASLRKTEETSSPPPPYSQLTPRTIFSETPEQITNGKFIPSYCNKDTCMEAYNENFEKSNERKEDSTIIPKADHNFNSTEISENNKDFASSTKVELKLNPVDLCFCTSPRTSYKKIDSISRSIKSDTYTNYFNKYDSRLKRMKTINDTFASDDKEANVLSQKKTCVQCPNSYELVDCSVSNIEDCLCERKEKSVNMKSISQVKSASQGVERKNILFTENTAFSNDSSVQTSVTDSTLTLLKQVLGELEKWKDNRGVSSTTTELTTSDLTRPEFVKMLTEIREHTKGLEEQLTIMNKNMKVKKRATDKSLPISELSTVDTVRKNFKQRRDGITQQPDKKNASIQEPCVKDCPLKFCLQKEKTEKRNVVDMKNKGELLENTANFHDKLTSRAKNAKQKKDIGTDSRICSRNVKQQFNDRYNELFTVCVNNTKLLEDYNRAASSECRKLCCSQNKENTSTIISSSNQRKTVSERTESTPFAKNLRYYSTAGQSEQNDRNMDSSRSFAFKESDVTRPLVASTPKKHKISSFTQTKPLFSETLHADEKTLPMESTVSSIKKQDVPKSINEINTPRENQSFNSDESKVSVALLLTRRTNSTQLKSKYKRSEFMNFKPKCVIYSPTHLDERSTRYKPRRRRTLSNMLKQFKSIKCNFEEPDTNCILNNKKNPVAWNTLTTTYTQSSNFQITAATSVSLLSLNERKETASKDFPKAPAREDTCTLS